MKSVGYGAVFYDVIGNVTITSALFAENREKNSSTLPDYASGGGMYIEFRSNCIANESYLNSGSNYIISKCNFISNLAKEAKSILSDSDCNQFLSFGRGGGLSFFARGSASNNNMTISDCHFEGNRALRGAGIYAEFDGKTGSNNIVIENSQFHNNTANLAGGGVRVEINSQLNNGSNTILLRNSNFSNNAAHIGGGIAQLGSSGKSESKEKVTIDNCSFSSNVADRGAAIHLYTIRVDVINTTVEGHVHDRNKNGYQCEGAAYFCRCSITLIDSNTFLNNEFTAIIFDSSEVTHRGHLLLQNNAGINGGGMGFYRESTLLMVPKSNLTFENNTAKKRGGAIYVERPISLQMEMKSTELQTNDCFILFGNDRNQTVHPDQSDTMTYFNGNRAYDTFGSNIYAYTLRYCKKPNEPLVNNSAFKWKVFKYNDSKFTDGRTTVVTDPVIINNVTSGEWPVYPGLPFSPTVVLRDENYNSVFGNIRVQLTAKDSDKLQIDGSGLFLVKDKIDSIRIYGVPSTNSSVLLETENEPDINKLSKEFSLKSCPAGYYFDNSTFKCVCLSQKLETCLGVTHCDDADNASVYILNGRWGDTNAKDVDFAVHICPIGYCKWPVNINEIDHKFEANKQCAVGRDESSVLCGSCESGKSVYFGNEDCYECTNNLGVLWLLLLIFVLTVVVFLVILVNVDTYASSLNALLYSYQIISLSTHGNTTLDIFIKIVIDLSTADGTRMAYGVCLWDNMNDLEKIALN